MSDATMKYAGGISITLTTIKLIPIIKQGLVKGLKICRLVVAL